jgi:hypothetical protein
MHVYRYDRSIDRSRWMGGAVVPGYYSTRYARPWYGHRTIDRIDYAGTPAVVSMFSPRLPAAQISCLTLCSAGCRVGNAMVKLLLCASLRPWAHCALLLVLRVYFYSGNYHTSLCMLYMLYLQQEQPADRVMDSSITQTRHHSKNYITTVTQTRRKP